MKEAEVYISIDGVLHVNLCQRKPILRVFSTGGSFYIDENGLIMPVSRKFTAHVPVASGFIEIDVKELYKQQHGLEADVQADTTLYHDLFKLSSFLSRNPLWEAQIEQVYVNKDSEFELIPRVGNHTIVLGEVHELEKKFRKLEIFYDKGLSKTGWNEFRDQSILKLRNQVVCTKRY